MAVAYLTCLAFRTLIVEIFEAGQHPFRQGIIGYEESHEMDKLFARGLADEMFDLAAVNLRLKFGHIQHLAQERFDYRLLRHDGLYGFLPFR